MTQATAVAACNCGRGFDLTRPEPLDQPAYDYRRRTDERVFDAPVTSVHAVLGRAEQRCWVEREQVQEDRGGRNVGGGIVGALIGGIIGHQIGGGSDIRIASTLPPVFSPNRVPRSCSRLNSA